jgi:3-oxoacyl-[acyl-carrier protein] reductase
MTAQPLAGRVCLLTGASGGIGAALARELAAAGADVALTYASHRADADRAADVVRQLGARAEVLPGDLADPAVPHALVEAAERALGPVDVLIANAGHAAQRPFADVDAGAWDETLNVNLRAPFLLAQAVLPGMCERGFGRVLFVSSVAAFTGGVVGADYAASKAGLHGLTHFLAARVASRGVTVNAIAPALIANTRMLPGDPEAPPIPIPVGRVGEPEEVADLALAMLRNRYLTSKVILLDGGIYPR